MLRTTRISLALLLLAAGGVAWAQDPTGDLSRNRVLGTETTEVASTGLVAPTVEMWFYEQERIRHDDPKMAVRRNAEMRAMQRRNRIAAQAWYGMSKSRPMVSPTAYATGAYSAHWGSNTYNPQRWQPGGAPTLIVEGARDRRY